MGENICDRLTAVRALELLGKLASVLAFTEVIEATHKVRLIDLTGDDVPPAQVRIGR